MLPPHRRELAYRLANSGDKKLEGLRTLEGRPVTDKLLNADLMYDIIATALLCWYGEILLAGMYAAGMMGANFIGRIMNRFIEAQRDGNS